MYTYYVSGDDDQLIDATYYGGPRKDEKVHAKANSRRVRRFTNHRPNTRRAHYLITVSPYCSLPKWSLSIREAAKRKFFFIGQSTKRGEGVRDCPLRKKGLFSTVFKGF